MVDIHMISDGTDDGKETATNSFDQKFACSLSKKVIMDPRRNSNGYVDEDRRKRKVNRQFNVLMTESKVKEKAKRMHKPRHTEAHNDETGPDSLAVNNDEADTGDVSSSEKDNEGTDNESSGKKNTKYDASGNASQESSDDDEDNVSIDSTTTAERKAKQRKKRKSIPGPFHNSVPGNEHLFIRSKRSTKPLRLVQYVFLNRAAVSK
jgi:hypothetical protein